jgi:2-oxoglutarate ferredoxin oxidoreductase subunit alpha
MPAVGKGFNVAVTASTHDERGVRFTQDATVHRRMVESLSAKINNHVDDITEVECQDTDDCEVGVVSFGCTSRAVCEAVERARALGIRAGFVRLKTIWPFPEKAIVKLTETAERIIVPEMNLGQVAREVERVACEADVVRLNKIGGGELITPEEVLDKIVEGGK